MANRKIRLVSLDIETSGLDPTRHVPLSIGAVDIVTGKDYYAGLEWDDLTVSIEAMRINRFDLTRRDRDEGDRLHSSRPGRTLRAARAIEEFALWLMDIRGADEELRALGKNPGSFDLPMLRPTWDGLCPDGIFGGKFPFSYRSVDLNTVFVAVAAARGDMPGAVKDVVGELAWNDLRREAPQADVHGSPLLPGRDEHWARSPEHHALADAWWNAYAWQRCVLMLKGDQC